MNTGKVDVMNFKTETKVEIDEESLFNNEITAQIVSNEMYDKKIKDELLVESQSIICTDLDIKSEIENEDQTKTNESRDNKIKDEFPVEPQSIICMDLDIKSEIENEDQTKTNELLEINIKDEYFDEPSLTVKDVDIKTEEEDHSNIKYLNSGYGKSPGTSYTCKYCQAGLITEDYRNAHEIKCSLRKKKAYFTGSGFECPHCKVLCTSEERRNRHQALCRKRGKSNKDKSQKQLRKTYYCDKCDFETDLIHRLRGHKRTHNNDVFSCKECPFQSNFKPNFKAHLKIHRTLGVVCVLCQKSFNKKVQLDSHYLSKHPGRRDEWRDIITSKIHECPQCDYKTVRSLSFEYHLATHETSADKFKYKCSVCEFKCIQRGNFTTHWRRHAGQLPFVCTECHKNFSIKKDLDGHILTRHSDNEQLMSSVTKKLHQCDKCNYKSVNSANLKRHLKTCNFNSQQNVLSQSAC